MDEGQSSYSKCYAVEWVTRTANRVSLQVTSTGISEGLLLSLARYSAIGSFGLSYSTVESVYIFKTAPKNYCTTNLYEREWMTSTTYIYMCVWSKVKRLAS